MTDILWRGFTLKQDPDDPTAWKYEDDFYMGVVDDPDEPITTRRFSAMIDMSGEFEGEGETPEEALEEALRLLREFPVDMQKWIEQLFPEKS
jgi:hypothetical protein